MTNQLQTIGIVGLGFTGHSIAACLLWKGLDVVGYTRPVEGYESAQRSIAAVIEDIIAHDAAPAALRDQWQTHYTEARELTGLKDCDFVIEAVPEDLELKRRMYAEIEQVIGPEVPLASNTSALPITQLQMNLKHPERFIGMHWAAPCQVNRFAEIVRGDRSADAAMNAAVELARRAGRQAGVVNKDVPGFVINRLAYALYREALHLIDQGIADAETIDNVFASVIGMWSGVMGPMRWIDLTGFALYAKVMERLLPTLDNRTDVPEPFKKLIESGAKGADPRTGGRGFFDYTPEQVRQWNRLVLENGWNIVKLTESYKKEFPETRNDKT